MGAVFSLMGLFAALAACWIAVVHFLPGARAVHAHSSFLGLFIGLKDLFGMLVFAVVGVIFMFVGFYLSFKSPTIVFNSSDETVSIRGQKGQSRPWADILGVQLIRGNSGRYQLNLLLDDAAKPRFNICDHGDEADITDLATHIAEITSRPLVNRL